MSALGLAHEHLGQAVDELERAIDGTPAYSVEALRFLRADLKDVVRRVANILRVIGDGGSPSAGERSTRSEPAQLGTGR